jgi:hypothetical protein
MSMLGNIFGRIFNRGQSDKQAAPAATAAPAQQQPAPAAPVARQPAPQQPAAQQPVQQQPAAQQPATQTMGAGAAAATMERVDVEQVLNGIAAQSGQKLNWRSSIVDLLKLLDLDSSLQARQELADELGYTGNKSDSAAMNIWLHKQVMRKLEENGGKVPADLKD